MQRRLLILVLTMLGIMAGASAQKNHKEYKTEKNGYKWIKVYSTDFKTVGVEDTDGNTIIPLSEQFSMISFVQEGKSGYFSVWKNDRNGAYSIKGVEMIPPAYDYLMYFGKEGFKYRSTNGKWYTLNVFLPKDGESISAVANNTASQNTYNEPVQKNESVSAKEQVQDLSEPVSAITNEQTNTPTVENRYNSTAQNHSSTRSITQNEFEPSWGIYDEFGFGFVMEDCHSLSFIIGGTSHFAKNVYATFGTGYMSLISNTTEDIYGTDVTMDGKAVVIPIYAGLAFRAGSDLYSIDPFLGIAFNIGVSSKTEIFYVSYVGGSSMFDMYESVTETYKNEDFGGKLGVALKLGIRIRIKGWHIMGRYNFPLNDNQENFFTGPDSYPEIGIGYML